MDTVEVFSGDRLAKGAGTGTEDTAMASSARCAFDLLCEPNANKLTRLDSYCFHLSDRTGR